MTKADLIGKLQGVLEDVSKAISEATTKSNDPNLSPEERCNLLNELRSLTACASRLAKDIHWFSDPLV